MQFPKESHSTIKVFVKFGVVRVEALKISSLSYLKSWISSGVQENESFFTNVGKGSTIIPKFRTNLWYYLVKPKNPKNPLKFFKVLGIIQSIMDLILLRSTFTPSWDTIDPNTLPIFPQRNIWKVLHIVATPLVVVAPCKHVKLLITKSF